MIAWGGKGLAWGAGGLRWGSSNVALTSELIGHWLVDVEYPDGDAYHVWTGPGDLVLDATTYTAVLPSLLSIGAMSSSERSEDERISIAFAITDPTLRSAFLQDPGVVRLRLRIAYTEDDGGSWDVVPRSVRGFLSAPVLEGGQYQCELVTIAGDIDRGRPQYWSDSDQQQRHEGDRGFEHLARLSDGEDIRWPPLS